MFGVEMSAQAVGGGIGQGAEPTLEEAEKQMNDALNRVSVAADMYHNAKAAQSHELIAFRAQRFSDLVGELAGASYLLQRAAYAKATK